MFWDKFGIPSVLSFIWSLIFTKIIHRIIIMSDNLKVLMIFTQKVELNWVIWNCSESESVYA